MLSTPGRKRLLGGRGRGYGNGRNVIRLNFIRAAMPNEIIHSPARPNARSSMIIGAIDTSGRDLFCTDAQQR